MGVAVLVPMLERSESEIIHESYGRQEQPRVLRRPQSFRRERFSTRNGPGTPTPPVSPSRSFQTFFRPLQSASITSESESESSSPRTASAADAEDPLRSFQILSKLTVRTPAHQNVKIGEILAQSQDDFLMATATDRQR